MRDNKYNFWLFSESEKGTRKQLWQLLYVCGFNAVMAISYFFNYRWFEQYPKLYIAVCIWYILELAIRCRVVRKGGVLYKEGLKRVEDWSYYYQSKTFASYDFNPARIGDYLLLNGGCVLRVDYSSWEEKLYLTDFETGEHVFSCRYYKGFGYWNSCIYELFKQIKACGKDVLCVYNKFGDIIWWQSDKPKKESKLRKRIYKMIVFVWGIISILIGIVPLLPLFKYLK